MNIKKYTIELFNEINLIENCFDNEINQWDEPAKLVILGEAPQSYLNYFYVKPGNFLSVLLKHYKKEEVEDHFLLFLRKKGILLLDIYKFPIPSEFYRNDKNNILYDESYFIKKLNKLDVKKKVNKETKFIFRYKMLINKYEYFQFALNNRKLVICNNNLEPLGVGKYSNNINPLITKYLP